MPASYLLAEFGLLMVAGAVVLIDLGNGRWFHALFVAVNAGLLAYAIARFVGLPAILEDLRVPRMAPLASARH